MFTINKLWFILFSFLISSCSIQQIVNYSKDEIYSLKYHLKYESDNPSRFIIYNGYVVSYNYKYRIPNFTYHKLTPFQISPQSGKQVKRRSSFYIDDYNLKRKSASNYDYKRSGFDKGHMVPAGDFYGNKILKDETFALTNICPQNPILNRGIWAYLEDRIRDKIIRFNKPAFIITGAIIDTMTCARIGLNHVGVPNYFYKIVFIPKLSLMYAFLFDNTITAYREKLENYQIKVDDIEGISGEDFFELLPDDFENKIESIIMIFQ